MTNVRNYTDDQLLRRVEEKARGFTHFPANYWLLGVRSNEDAFNVFDDKFYLFEGVEFVDVYTGTTNPGSRGLKKFHTYNELGAAVLQADRIVYGGYKRGWSKGREVYRQEKGFPYYRDNDYDNKSEEIGKVYNDVIYAHIHDVKLDEEDLPKMYINGWSLACQVMNSGKDWHEFMELTKEQELMTYCLLNEFKV